MAAHIFPSVDEKAFNCPHCGALAKQFWHDLHAVRLDDDRTPIRLTQTQAEQFSVGLDDAELRDKMIKWAADVAKKRPLLSEDRSDPYGFNIYNVSMSKCYNCSDVAVWIGDMLVYPQATTISVPNADLPDEAKHDYREAASIVHLSARGAAALLRLAIQKVAISLGGDGKNLNEDIAMLVEGGLDKRVQKSLDVVRVIGNNAVHPGEIDIRDDTTTAEKLFELVNLIADIMISQPKHVAALYDALPEGARHAVEKRDKAAIDK